jgi:glycosyltransferase involved in cell wall biosynthesis
MVLFTGSIGFPYGSAVAQRLVQLAKSLMHSGYKVTVIARRGIHSKEISHRENISSIGQFQKINYIHCTLFPYRPSNYLLRNLLKILGYTIEPFILFFFISFNKVDYIFNNSINLNELKYYYYLSRLFNVKLVYDYVEVVDSLGKRGGHSVKELKKSSFDKNFFRFTNRIITISSFLEHHVEDLAPNFQKIRIPPIIDFYYIDGVEKSDIQVPYFLFCGSAAYFDIINFVIDVFCLSEATANNWELKLVINGSPVQLDKVKKYIQDKSAYKNIVVLSNIAYYNLISLYKSSNALLIPISNTLQDRARFPFKICEYTASGRPIVTSNFGAVLDYFIDGDTAFIAEVDDLDSYAQKLNTIIREPERADKIGKNGYLLSKQVFNYRSYSSKLSEFLK